MDTTTEGKVLHKQKNREEHHHKGHDAQLWRAAFTRHNPDLNIKCRRQIDEKYVGKYFTEKNSGYQCKSVISDCVGCACSPILISIGDKLMPSKFKTEEGEQRERERERWNLV